MNALTWKIGFEIELLAPKGKNRKDLAEALALKYAGHSKRCFYPQSEPSAVRGTPVFENLTLGFDVYDTNNKLVVKCVDDLTIRQDLNKNAESRAGWYRILSDDPRLLRLIIAQCDPQADKWSVLTPIAELFNTQPKIENEVVRVADVMSAPIALAASLPGERERPCEMITPPIETDHLYRLKSLLETAIELGFSIPHEAAIHMHFDAEKLCDTHVFLRLIKVLKHYGEELKQAVNTNPHCTRLGKLPAWLLKTASKPGFRHLEWPRAREQLRGRGLTKYCDYNIMNFVYQLPGKSTFEVRIFPGSQDSQQIIENAYLFETILNWCVIETAEIKFPRKLERFMALIK